VFFYYQVFPNGSFKLALMRKLSLLFSLFQFAIVEKQGCDFLKMMRKVNQNRIPNQLRKCRRAEDYKQKEVAKMFGLKSSSIISRWESGFCLPKPARMFDLAILYQKSVDELFSGFRKSRVEAILKAKQKFLQNKAKEKMAQETQNDE